MKKSKTIEHRKPTNSQVIREISPEGTSGLWRVGFMEKKKCRGDGGESGDAETGKLT